VSVSSGVAQPTLRIPPASGFEGRLRPFYPLGLAPAREEEWVSNLSFMQQGFGSFARLLLGDVSESRGPLWKCCRPPSVDAGEQLVHTRTQDGRFSPEPRRSGYPVPRQRWDVASAPPSSQVAIPRRYTSRRIHRSRNSTTFREPSDVLMNSCRALVRHLGGCEPPRDSPGWLPPQTPRKCRSRRPIPALRRLRSSPAGAGRAPRSKTIPFGTRAASTGSTALLSPRAHMTRRGRSPASSASGRLPADGETRGPQRA